MAVETTYTALRAGLAGFLDQVTDDREVVFGAPPWRTRRSHTPRRRVVEPDGDCTSVAFSKNAERLFEAIRWAEQGNGEPETVESLRRSVGLEPAK